MTRFVLLLLASVLACTPELEPIHWDPIDVDALRDAIDHPTGIVDEASANEVASAIVQRQAPAKLLSRYLANVFAGADAGDEAPIWIAPQALDGTSVYVIVACPGPLRGDAPPFAHGSVRVDSSTLDLSFESTSELLGQLLFEFTACEIGPFVFDGSAIVYRTISPAEFGLMPDLEFGRVDQSTPPRELREPVLWRPDRRVSALYELKSGETLALDWSIRRADLRLRGSNGELACAIVGAKLDCEAP